MNLTLVLQGLIKVFGAAALLLGLAFWLGYARPLTQLHVGLGIGQAEVDTLGEQVGRDHTPAAGG